MAIKVSQIISSNTLLQDDPSPTLGGILTTNDYPIENNGNPVTITGNKYPVTTGTSGQVLTTDGTGNVVYTTLPTVHLDLYTENSLSPTIPQALGTNSIALGNAATTGSTAFNSLAIGNQSLSRIPGGVVQANGRFSSTGDAQTGRYLLRSHTVNNAPTELFIDGTNGNISLTLSDDVTWTFKITVCAHRTDADDGHAGYILSGVIYRNAGVASTQLQGSVQKIILSESNPSWDVSVVADQINGSLKILVLGETGKIIRWVALVETVEITN